MSALLRGPLAPIGHFRRDARLLLLTTFVGGAALSLWWIDFNLYLAALGLSRSEIGTVSTIASLAGGLAAFPASALSDRLGRRAVIALGGLLSIAALVALILTDALPVIVLAASIWAVGQQAISVPQAPYLIEHSDPGHRNELFATQYAITIATNIIAAFLGGVVATSIAAAAGLDPEGPATYRVILVLMLVLLVAAMATIGLLGDDRPSRVAGPSLRRAGEPAAFPRDPRRRRARLGLVVRDRGRFARLVVPGLLIAVGAGQVIPFLNVFIQEKFGLDVAELNGVFALMSFGSMLAVLAQPVLARRRGRVASVVIVQGLSIPFLVVLGFSPLLWTVILAMVVRNSLMNAGNPIFTAFAMEHVDPAERATLSATLSVLWSVGWVIGGGWYAWLQGTFDFDGAYGVAFATIIVLYTVATALYWAWFRAADRPAAAAAARAA